MALVPLFEYFNHQSHPNCRFSVKHLDDQSYEIHVRTVRNIRAGEELSISYVSSASNAQLLATYGFTDPNNVQALELTTKELEKVCREVLRREEGECRRIFDQIEDQTIQMSSKANRNMV